MAATGQRLGNVVNGQPSTSHSSQEWLPVTTPHTGQIVAHVLLSDKQDVDVAIQQAHQTFLTDWSLKTVKTRVQILLKFHYLVQNKYAHELAALIVREHGKTTGEALAEIAKGLETVEYAASLPQLVQGRYLEVSRGVSCRDERVPLGVVASIVPLYVVASQVYGPDLS